MIKVIKIVHHGRADGLNFETMLYLFGIRIYTKQTLSK